LTARSIPSRRPVLPNPHYTSQLNPPPNISRNNDDHSHPSSTFGRVPNFATSRPPNRPNTKDSEKQAIWVPCSTAPPKGKTRRKQLLVLGGTPDQQREFLETLARRRLGLAMGMIDENGNKTPPVSNKYALGYTYRMSWTRIRKTRWRDSISICSRVRRRRLRRC